MKGLVQTCIVKLITLPTVAGLAISDVTERWIGISSNCGYVDGRVRERHVSCKVSEKLSLLFGQLLNGVRAILNRWKLALCGGEIESFQQPFESDYEQRTVILEVR